MSGDGRTAWGGVVNRVRALNLGSDPAGGPSGKLGRSPLLLTSRYSKLGLYVSHKTL